ncbi:MAG: HD domain-containing phosphohydrolase, partial [Dehalococcoidia bacterium]|nr:HD domain-containing phosphohydrolase [Dehalococcoidia bacterium]
LRLAESARRFGAGEQVPPIAVTSRDEVGTLTESFNAMVVEIGEGRSRQETQQARLHTLWELDLAISFTLSLPEVLDIVAEEILRHGSVRGLAVYLLDDAGALAPVMSRGIARSLVTGRSERRLEDVAQEAILAGEPVMRELTTRPPSSDLTSADETIAFYIVPLASRGKSLGAILFCANRSLGFTEDEREFLYGVGLQASTAVENARLYGSEQRRVADLEAASEKLKGQRDDLQRAQEGIMETLNLALQAKDPYTRGHAERVGLLARRIAARLGLPREAQDVLARAAKLHDIGKISIPEYLLNKEGALTPPERTQFELHPERSAELLRHLPDLDQVLPTIRAHHERYDGKGYPDGLAGDEIPLGARIIAAADAYDALTTNRPYRAGMSHERAIEVLQTHAGTQWDPAVVHVLLESFNEEEELGEDRSVSRGSD